MAHHPIRVIMNGPSNSIALKKIVSHPDKEYLCSKDASSMQDIRDLVELTVAKMEMCRA